MHELGAWWGLSLISGHLWGYRGSVKYMPIDLTYSYLINPHGKRYHIRYTPEMTALALMDQQNLTATSSTSPLKLRQRVYGSGLSPIGLRSNFYTHSRIQPYFDLNGGFIYFADRVLSPQGSQWMYTASFGFGLEIFRKPRQSVSIGYRYTHLSNADISQHNPGTDANTFYVKISRYRSKGYR